MMERIAVIVEETGARTSALLNPESIRLRRQSGLRTLTSQPGSIVGAVRSDDALVATSGGRTEIELDLLFDVDLLPPAVPAVDPSSIDPDNPGQLRHLVPESQDVRTLTSPLWALSENRATTAGGPPTCLVVWGKHLKFSAVVEAVTERLERFDAVGIPRRSFLSLRLLRTGEHTPIEPSSKPLPPPISSSQTTPQAPIDDAPGTLYHEVVGAGDGPLFDDDGELMESGHRGERLDEIAMSYYGDPAYWRHLAAVNDLDDLPWVPQGRVLIIPPIDVLAAPPTPEAEPEPGFDGEPDPGSTLGQPSELGDWVEPSVVVAQLTDPAPSPDQEA